MITTKSTDSAITETLKSICCSSGWCYGLFWGFDQSNSLLLTFKDAYYEEKIQALAHNMLQQVHTLGGGLIGQVALSQKHKWIQSDAHQEIPDPYDDQSQNDFEFFSQFLLGIKTVALIPVEPHGVVQFGSTEKIPEKDGFEDCVRESFKAAIESISATRLSKLAMDNEFEEELFFEPSNIFSFSGPQTAPTAGTDLSYYQQAKYNPSVFDPTYGNKDSRTVLTLDDLFQENYYCPIMEDVAASLWPSQLQHSTDGFISLPNSNIHNSLITNSIQSSIVTDPFVGSSNNVKTLKRLELCQEFDRSAGQNDPGSNLDGSIFPRDASREKNSLFSKLGLDQILELGFARFEDQSCSAAKRRKTGNSCSWIQCEEKKFQNPSVYNNLDAIKSEASTKEQAGSFITADFCSEKTSSSSKIRQVEATKSGKKKAKPGTKPRPKDRQMIQDRLAELRYLIPNGEKMSIDRLLERTIKHLNYMQSLTKHAHVLKQIHKPKAAADVKDKGGATWAYEVGDETVVCPLIVEDLNAPGQMLIEILCDEQGFFLEIADIIRSFGLIVLKGTMELRDTKIWAHFLAEAEANRRVTRHEVFSSLIQLLQMRVKNAADSSDCNKRTVGYEAFLFDNYEKKANVSSFPMNVANNPLRCASVRRCS